MDTPLDKKLIGDQHKLPEALKAKIEAAPMSFLSNGVSILSTFISINVSY